jgi:threonine dehydrogenase-like Zn-dependent dehydrogenase
VGLLAIAAARRLGAGKIVAVDPALSRLRLATTLGAEGFPSANEAVAAVLDETGGRGADAVMELVGLPEAAKLAFRLIRPGGTMSVIGCHCSPNFAFSPANAYDKNLTYRTGRCPARHYMDRLAAELASEPIDLKWCITDRFDLQDAARAYDTFAYRKQGCVKAVLSCHA